MRLVLSVVVVATSAILVGIGLFAPHLPSLLAEGWPAARWPAAGSYALVAGAPSPGGGLGPQVVAPIDQGLALLFDESEGDALVVLRSGHLAAERYRDGIGPDDRFNSFSLVKSLVGVLVLKAIAEGRIGGLDDPIGRYLSLVSDKALAARPLRSFLDMRSGLTFEMATLESVSGPVDKDMEARWWNPFGPLAHLHGEGLQGIAAGLAVDPGAVDRFSYQNANTALLAAVLEAIYGQGVETLLSEKIWRPAGAADAYWRRPGEGRPVSAYCCLYATPRDWALVGAFLAANGLGEQPFLPHTFWAAYFGADLAPAALREDVYRLHVRHNLLDRPGERLHGRFTYFLGAGGQTVWILPDHDLVVVRFGRKQQLLHSTLYGVWRTIASRP